VAVRLFYIDDSGTEQTGFITYSWLCVDITQWRPSLRGLLDWRLAMSEQHQIPVRFEFHATEFLRGEGNPSLDAAWNRRKANRNIVAKSGLAQLGQLPGLSLGTTYRKTSATRRAYAAERADVYDKTVQLIDGLLTADGDLGIIVMDGNGTDPSYRRAHRNLKLATRSLIEDPAFQPSNESQFVQMADLVAYVSYQHLNQAKNRRFMWSWFPTYLAGLHYGGAPQAV
jgi:hypothetical protein